MIFYSCDWRIIPTAGFTKLADLSDELGCGLVFVQPIQFDDANVARLQFSIRNPSQQAIDDFIRGIPDEMQIRDWKPVDEEVYSRGINFSEFWNNLEPLEQDSWMDAIIRYGYANQENKDG